MKQTLSLFDFRRAFYDHDRANFSYDGLNILYDALTDLEQDTGNETELDVIGLCCEFSEMTEQEVINSYSLIDDDVEDFLSDNTWLCGRTEQNTLVFRQF